MKLETSTSSLDTQMAKENAIKGVVTSGKESLNQLGSWIKANAAKATLFTALTFTAPAAFGQIDVAKNDKKPTTYTPTNSIDTAKNTVKIGDEPIKDSVEYKKKRDELLKEWEKVMEERKTIAKEREAIEIENKQIERLNGPLLVFKQMQLEGREITSQDVIWANGRIESFSRVNWVPGVKPLLDRAMALLQYIATYGPQQTIVKTN